MLIIFVAIDFPDGMLIPALSTSRVMFDLKLRVIQLIWLLDYKRDACAKTAEAIIETVVNAKNFFITFISTIIGFQKKNVSLL